MKTINFLAPTFLALVAANSASALNVLVVNDDGCNATGIAAVASALSTAGHQVTVVAPSGNQSGTGSRQTLPDTKVGQLVATFNTSTNAAGYTCISATLSGAPGSSVPSTTASATPRDAVLIGLKLLAAQNITPDLVVSGVNEGANVGELTTPSGTVSAAVAALRSGIPAIAMSADILNRQAPILYADAANFVVKVVAKLSSVRRNKDKLLPDHVALNLNYPQVAPKGVKYTHIGEWTQINIVPAATSTPGQFEINFLNSNGIVSSTLPSKPDLSLEGQALASGYVTVSGMDGQWDVDPLRSTYIATALSGLKP